MLSLLKRAVSPQGVLVLYVGIVFLIGGSARADIASLIVLRPISVLVLAYGLYRLKRTGWREQALVLGLAAAWTGLVALHLVPLPPGLWHAMPGRELAVAIDQATGLSERWRPLSLVPHRTLNALFSLSVPLAALALAASLPRAELRVTIYLVLAMAFVGAALSVLQVIGGAGNPFYLYRVTNADSAVGLFANRNHHAIHLALAMAMLGAVAVLRQPPRELRRAWSSIMGGLAIALVPFLILAQSRAGLILGLLALGAFVWLQSGPSAPGQTRRRELRFDPRIVALAIGAVSMGALTWLLTAGGALSRLASGGSADDTLRLRIWEPTVELVGQYFPAGSGIGTFVEVYEVAEPLSTLGPRYINHAHNDWLELALTGGLPALVLIVAGTLAIGLAGWRRMRECGRGRGDPRDLAMRRTGLVVLAFLALGSVYDYPLRTPSLAIVFSLAIIWFAGAARTANDYSDEGVRRRAAADDCNAPHAGGTRG